MYGRFKMPHLSFFILDDRFMGETNVNPLKCKGTWIQYYIFQSQIINNNYIFVWYKYICNYCRNTQIKYWDNGYSGTCYHCSCVFCGNFIRFCSCNKIDKNPQTI
jgi:hypothetical protein